MPRLPAAPPTDLPDEDELIDSAEELLAFYWWVRSGGATPNTARCYKLCVSALLTAAGLPPDVVAAASYLQDAKPAWAASCKTAWRKWRAFCAATKRPASWAPREVLTVGLSGPPADLLIPLAALQSRHGGTTVQILRAATWADVDNRQFDGQPFLRHVPPTMLDALTPLRAWATTGCDEPDSPAEAGQIPLVPMEPGDPMPVTTGRLITLLREARGIVKRQKRDEAEVAAHDARKAAGRKGKPTSRGVPVVDAASVEVPAPKVAVPALDALREPER